MFRSIRWKFVTIYFILVLIAMLIAGIFIIAQIDELHINSAKADLDNIEWSIMPHLELAYSKTSDIAKSDIEVIVNNYGTMNVEEDEVISVIDVKKADVLASSKEVPSDLAKKHVNIVLKTELNDSSYKVVKRTDNNVRIVSLTSPIKVNGEITGMLYIYRDLSKIDSIIDNIRDVILKAILFSSIATILLGFIISKSISDPIKALTKKAVLMSKGDFEHYVEVKSNDEIGELSETFNFLTRRLKKSLREISLEKTKVEAIVNHMTDGVVAVDNRHHVIHINPKAVELMELGTDAYFEADFDKIVAPISSDLCYTHITENIQGWIGSELISIKDSIIKFNYAPYVNDKNEKVGIVYVLQDFTESEKLDSMRRDFVANVSHELKTPLTSIKSYTETLLDGYVDDPDTQKEFLNVIDSEAERMTRLVRDLLQLSNFDSDKTIFYKEYNDYIDLLRKSTDKLVRLAKEKNISIKITTMENQLVGLFDLHRIEQVFINIISNAIKYTTENGSVDIQVFEKDEKAVIRIRDTGIGIPADDLNHIFDRFYRVDKARTRNMGGTGLGLAIAKEIVNGHSGVLDITSTLGKGTTVTIAIPMETVM